MITIGVALSVFIGILLGLLGGGGSILTVPLLHYVFSLEANLAVFFSLFVVGTVACLGAALSHLQGLVQWKKGALFAIPSIGAVFLTRRFILPSIPPEFIVFGTTVTKGTFTLICFGTVMLLAGIAMVKSPASTSQRNASLPGNRKLSENTNFAKIALAGALVGFVTGFVGAGGGFLIVPALTLLLGMGIKKAVATSLAIISVNSLGGFFSEFVGKSKLQETALGNFSIDLQWLHFFLPADASTNPWPLLLLITGLAVAGMYLGILLQSKVSPAKLKPTFGYFVLISAILIILKEAFFI